MERSTTAVGLPAVLQSLEILARSNGRRIRLGLGGRWLEPGAVWNGDTVLLSAAGRAVEYARGDALIHEDTSSFLKRYPGEWHRPVWTTLLLSVPKGAALRMAQALVPWWGPRGSVCAWLSAYGAFYCSHRTDIELANRHAGLMLDGLFGLRPLWTSLFYSLVETMGEGAHQLFERRLGPSDVAPLLGILLGTRGQAELSVGGLAQGIAALRQSPTPDFEALLSVPLYPMLVRRAEDAALQLAPVVSKLRSGL